MSASSLFLLLIVLAVAGYYLGRTAAKRSAAASGVRLHSLPAYYGYYVALWCALPSLLVCGVWLALEDRVIQILVIDRLPADILALAPDRLGLVITDIRNMAHGNIASREATPAMQAAVDHYLALRGTAKAALWVVGLSLAVGGLLAGRALVRPQLRARNRVEAAIRILLIVSSTIAIFTTIGIVLSLLLEAIRFFTRISLFEFLFGLTWSPQTAIRAEQVGASGAFGAVPLFTGSR